MVIFHVLILVAGLHSILFGLYLVMHGRRQKRANLFLGIFVLQLGLNSLFVFLQLSEYTQTYPLLFYLPWCVATLQPLIIWCYFREIIPSAPKTFGPYRVVWLIPVLDALFLLFILGSYLLGEDTWSDTTRLPWVKPLYVIGVQGLEAIMGILVVIDVRRMINHYTVQYYEKYADELNSGLRWLRQLWVSYVIFNGTILLLYGIVISGNHALFMWTLLITRTAISALLYWINFMTLKMPKAILMPWHPLPTLRPLSVGQALRETQQPVLITDQCQVVSYANQKFLRLLGYSKAELKTKRLTDLLLEEDRGSLDKIYQDTAYRSLSCELRFATKSGEPCWTHTHVHLLLEANQQVSCYIFLVRQHTLLPGTGDGETPTSVSLTSAQLVFKEQLERVMTEDQLFVDPQLSLHDLAQRLETSSRLTSSYITAIYGQNFREFVNEYRVWEAIRIMSNPEYDQYTLAAIGLEAGFNSRSSFYATFKKTIGRTPLNFKKHYLPLFSEPEALYAAVRQEILLQQQ